MYRICGQFNHMNDDSFWQVMAYVIIYYKGLKPTSGHVVPKSAEVAGGK